tara:strand:+ start:159 stop:548 length:390 start_codon:yes stop_codon:yes gene_type:complete
MGKRRSGGGKGMFGTLFDIAKKNSEEIRNRRAIQDAGSAEERERIEAKQQGREAFTGARWEGFGKAAESAPAAPEAPSYTKLKIQDPSTIKKTTYQSTKARKKLAPKTKSPTSAMAGSLGSTSGGTVSL